MNPKVKEVLKTFQYGALGLISIALALMLIIIGYKIILEYPTVRLVGCIGLIIAGIYGCGLAIKELILDK